MGFKKYWPIFAFGFLIIFLAAMFGSFKLISLTKSQKKESGNSDAPKEKVSLNTNPAVLPVNGERVNVLLLGQGGAGHDGGALTDSMILISVDRKNKKAAFISVPRDLFYSGQKINGIFASQGWKPAAEAVGKVTGLLAQDYILVDFGGFTKVIDALGGISVNVPKTYDDYFYPVKGKEFELCGKSPEEVSDLHTKYSGFELEKQFSCRYEHLHFDKGLVDLKGSEALKYVRSRHGDGDFGRSERQFAVLSALENKVLSLAVFQKGNQLLDSLLSLVKTDLDKKAIYTLVDFFGNSQDYQTVSIHLTDGNVLNQGKSAAGAYILLPKEGEDKWSAVQNYIFEKL